MIKRNNVRRFLRRGREPHRTLRTMQLVAVAVAVAVAAIASAVTATSTLGLASSRLTRGDTIHLRWTGVSAEHYPLALQARFFNDTDDGVFSIRTTIASKRPGEDDRRM